MNLYLLPAIWVATVLTGMHLTDSTARKTDRHAWMVIGLTTVLWPVVLPVSAVELYRKSSLGGTIEQLDSTETAFEGRY
ncbi:MAG: hypothetical protein AAF152_14015 [Cyanobacteria bacterium P01_A01_bin.114]